MKKLLLSCTFAFSALAVSAQVSPKVTPEAPAAGQKYILVNKAQDATQYMSRTSWDGALYFLGKDASHYADYAFLAEQNENGTWAFSYSSLKQVDTGEVDEDENPIMDTIEEKEYLVIPAGGGNLKTGLEPAEWKLEAKGDGFYCIIAGEGNNSAMLADSEYTPTGDMRLHLNNGKQYFVITHRADSWFPDCFGGISDDFDEATSVEYYSANDSVSFNWGFISPENIDAYYADMQYVSMLNKYYSDYSELADYADGFIATFNAAVALYQATDIAAMEEAGLKAMLDAKVELYKAIDAAIVANEKDDALLNAAIEKAQKVFDSVTATDDVNAAMAELNEALRAYSLGVGEFTAFGKNMSFEDLSAQGGIATSGVAGAPAGWNVYINGKQAVTVDDIKAGGITAWHGINGDAEGDPMDGSMIFGLWSGSVPEYEISQTVEGLENGSYTVSAGLMAGSNGNGSRLTTQRIFANLNSTYYGCESDYDANELDGTEVYQFADNEILTTDREMRLVEVHAYVYDGTLTFGLRTNGNFAANYRTSGNSSGGDGWFKVDNFRIIKEEFQPEDALGILRHYLSSLSDFDRSLMPEVTSELLDEQSSALEDITKDSPIETINAGILNARDLVGTASEAIKAYKRLAEAVEQHENGLEAYEAKEGIDAYIAVIMEVSDSLSDCYYTVEQVDAAILRLEEARKECIASGSVEPGMELTDRIENPSFEDLSTQNGQNSSGVAAPPVGWTLVSNGVECKTVADMNANGIANWCAINSGDNISVTNTNGEDVTAQYTDGEHLWGIWASAVPEVELSQVVAGLPAGTYTLSVDMVVQNDWAGNNLGTQRVFANEYVCMFGDEYDYIQNIEEELFDTFPADIKGAKALDDENPENELKHLTYASNYSSENYGASGAPYTTSVTFGLAERGNVKIGVRTSRLSAVDAQISSQASLGWLKIDNWRLVYDSDEVPEGAELTGIKNVASSQATAVEFFSLSGARLSAPQRGVNIVKIGSDVKKVFVK